MGILNNPAPAAPAEGVVGATNEPTNQPVNQPQAGSPAPVPDGTWYASLPEDLRTNPNVVKYKSVDELVNGHINLVGKLGQRPPEPPESPDKYTWAPPEGMELDADAILEAKRIAHSVGLPDDRAKSLLDYHFGEVTKKRGADAQAIQAELDAANKHAVQQLQQEWGHDYDRNVRTAESVLTRVPELAKLCQAEGLDSSPEFVRFLVQYEKTMARPAPTPPNAVPASTGGVDQQIADLKKSDAYKNRSHPGWQRAQDAYVGLMRQKYGD